MDKTMGKNLAKLVGMMVNLTDSRVHRINHAVLSYVPVGSDGKATGFYVGDTFVPTNEIYVVMPIIEDKRGFIQLRTLVPTAQAEI